MYSDALVNELKEYISSNLDISRDYSDEEILNLIEDGIFQKSKEAYLSIAQKSELISLIFNSMRKLDILQPLIDDGLITEIMINGPDTVFIERGGSISKEKTGFESEEKLYNIIQSIVSRIDRSVNEASPIVDARLKDGSRVNVVLPPIALNGPIVTIRKFPEKPLTMEKLTEVGSITREAADFLEKLVKGKYNIFISGGTGSGKTTFLNALSGYIPGYERVITIEDSAELQIQNILNLVRLETRNANTEGKGEITIRELIKTSLRMRPDRIIVGEVRGPEALDMLQAMNTGHDGSFSTGHGNSTADMLSRLETMVLSGAILPLEAIRQQVASALDIVIHLGRVRDMSRKVLEITELVAYRDNRFVLNPLFIFEEEDSDKYTVAGKLKRTENSLVNVQKLKMAGIRL